MNPREVVMYEMLHAIAEAVRRSPSTPINEVVVTHHDQTHLDCKSVYLDVDVLAFVEAVERGLS